VLDVRARGVEVRVVGDDLPLAADKLEEDALAGAPLVGRQDVGEPGESCRRDRRAEEDWLPA
jgi:hypothetical protein